MIEAAEGFPTDTTDKFLHPRVNQLVLFQVRSLPEVFPADAAAVWSSRRVDPLVHGALAGRVEAFPAYPAQEGLARGMRPDVETEVVLSSERFRAERATVRLYPAVGQLVGT